MIQAGRAMDKLCPVSEVKEWIVTVKKLTVNDTGNKCLRHENELSRKLRPRR